MNADFTVSLLCKYHNKSLSVLFVTTLHAPSGTIIIKNRQKANCTMSTSKPDTETYKRYVFQSPRLSLSFILLYVFFVSTSLSPSWMTIEREVKSRYIRTIADPPVICQVVLVGNLICEYCMYLAISNFVARFLCTSILWRKWTFRWKLFIPTFVNMKYAYWYQNTYHN